MSSWEVSSFALSFNLCTGGETLSPMQRHLLEGELHDRLHDKFDAAHPDMGLSFQFSAAPTTVEWAEGTDEERNEALTLIQEVWNAGKWRKPLHPKKWAFLKSFDAYECYVTDGYGPHTYFYEGKEYWVLTNKEADEQAFDRFKSRLWALSARDLSEVVPSLDAYPVAHAFDRMREAVHRDINDFVADLIGEKGISLLFKSALDEIDGRAKLIGAYNGEEYEEKVEGTAYYIYQMTGGKA